MNDGLVAAIAHSTDEPDIVNSSENSEDKNHDFLENLLPDFAFVASHLSDPTTLNEAL